MAQPSFDAFFWAISQQESGGNYSAVGPPTKYGRAYGKYQVLAPNVGPWTAKYFGRRLTAAQFLANPQAQEAVARGVLQSYYNRYGARGAAAMWYSGQSNPNKTYGNPPVYKYVNSVMGHAGGYSGQSATSGGSSYSAGTVTPALDEDELAASYGLTSSLINSSKELKSLFRKAVSGSWSANRFQASLKNTKWWKTQSNTLRQYVTQRYEDPATWKQKNTAAWYKVNGLAVQVGLASQLTGGKPSKLLQDAAYRSVALGWTDARIKDWLGTRVTTHDGVMWGEAGEAFDKLHEIAYLNGLKFDTYYEKAARGIARGVTTLETEEAKLRRLAAAQYGAFRDQILAGQNAMDLASPYISSVASILELPQTDVDLFNSHVQKAMRAKPQPDGSQYSVWQFENDLRADPLWKKTNNARESMMGTAHQVLKDFGLAF